LSALEALRRPCGASLLCPRKSPPPYPAASGEGSRSRPLWPPDPKASASSTLMPPERNGQRVNPGSQPSRRSAVASSWRLGLLRNFYPSTRGRTGFLRTRLAGARHARTGHCRDTDFQKIQAGGAGERPNLSNDFKGFPKSHDARDARRFHLARGS